MNNQVFRFHSAYKLLFELHFDHFLSCVQYITDWHISTNAIYLHYTFCEKKIYIYFFYIKHQFIKENIWRARFKQKTF